MFVEEEDVGDGDGGDCFGSIGIKVYDDMVGKKFVIGVFEVKLDSRGLRFLLVWFSVCLWFFWFIK